MGLVEDFVSLLLSSPTTVLGAVFLLLILYYAFVTFTPTPVGNEPPGPKPLPLLGNLLQLDLTRPHQSLCEFAKTYGSVFTVHFGLTKVVVLSGYKTIKEALVSYGTAFGDRDINPILKDTNRGHGILFANGASWKVLRRFALSTLRDFGMGTSVAENHILEELEHLVRVIEGHKGKPFDTGPPLTQATANVISFIVFGSRFEYSDPMFKNLVKRTNQTITLVGSPSIQLYNNFPRLARWVKNRRLILGNVTATIKDMTGLIKRLRDTLIPHINRGLVDCFLTRKQKEEDSSVPGSHFTDENLLFTVTNLFSAGTETTATTLKWGLLYMAKYPHIQDKVQEELSRVVGSRQVRMEDRRSLPYTDAVVHETQRMANIVPLNLPHQTSQDVTFQGHFIKKGTTVFPLLTTVLNDENEWESPNTFNPAHFLDAEGKFIRRDAFMPFSAGRRACLGEGLAKMELFLFVAVLLQRFRFVPPPGLSVSDLELTPALGLTLSPVPHQLCALSLQ